MRCLRHHAVAQHELSCDGAAPSVSFLGNGALRLQPNSVTTQFGYSPIMPVALSAASAQYRSVGHSPPKAKRRTILKRRTNVLKRRTTLTP